MRRLVLELLKRLAFLGRPIFNTPKPLKILVLARFADRRGGADVYTESLTTQLAERGHTVYLFCHSASPAVHASCQVFEFPDSDSSQLKLIWRLASWFYQRHWRKFLADHSDLKPDVIISSMPLSSGDVKNSFRGVPWVYLPHSRIAPVEATAEISESGLQKRFTRRLYSRWERWTILNASTTIRFTAGNETALRSYYRLPKMRRSILFRHRLSVVFHKPRSDKAIRLSYWQPADWLEARTFIGCCKCWLLLKTNLGD